MSERLNYISDEELERLMAQVEQEELVAAPPDLMESILEAAEFSGAREELSTAKVIPLSAAERKREFRAYCFRVITSVAAAIALAFLLPELTNRMNVSGVPIPEPVDKSTVVGTVPDREEIVRTVPDRATVVGVQVTPSKEEVLNDTGFIEQVINNTGWFNKESND